MSTLVAGNKEKLQSLQNKDEDDYDLHFGDIDENEPLFGDEFQQNGGAGVRNKFAAYQADERKSFDPYSPCLEFIKKTKNLNESQRQDDNFLQVPDLRSRTPIS